MPYFSCPHCLSRAYSTVSYLHPVRCPSCEAQLRAAKDPSPRGLEPVRGRFVLHTGGRAEPRTA